MRVLEMVSSVLCIVMLICMMINNKRRVNINGKQWIEWILIVEGILLLIHIFVEKARWQMLGIYFLTLLLFVQMIVNMVRKESVKKTTKNRFIFVYLLIVVLSIIVMVLFPVNKIPEPIGEYKVGTMTYDLTDDNREEIYGSHKGDTRKIRIQLWYPATVKDEKLEDWIPDGTIVSDGLMQLYGLPSFIMNQIALVPSNSYKNAMLAEDIETMPIVVISHGWTGFRNLHTDWAEMLASSGYFVIGIDHTYGSIGLTFDDGEEISVDLEALPDREIEKDFLEYAEKLVGTFAMDDKLVIDHVDKINDGTAETVNSEILQQMFQGKLDIDKIGMIGHSTGGGGVVKLALNDSRIGAVIGFDPWIEPIGEEKLKEPMHANAMFFRSTEWSGGINDDYVKQVALNETNQLRIYEIKGSKHQDFTMMYQLGPMPGILGVSGELDCFESAEIQQNFILEFMNQYLRDENTNIDDLVYDYEEVFEVFHKE